ncbi:hypothetical protein MASR2M117_14200 [Paludibacter sp.]
MSVYESSIKTISSSEEVVFNLLSDMNNLSVLQGIEGVDNKVKIIELEVEKCYIEIDKFGKVGLEIVGKTPNRLINYNFTQLPMKMTAEISLEGINNNQTNMQLKLIADIPFMLKAMLDSQLEKGVNALADMFEKTLNRNNK